MWTLANNPRVPEKIRNDVSRWGLCKDEFIDIGGWPHQLYVREARRMVSDYVMTQHDCQGRAGRRRRRRPGCLHHGLAQCAALRRRQGHVRNEGDVQVGGFPPYPISYRSIVPQGRASATNLLVPGLPVGHRTSPTAPSAWSPSSWCSANRRPPPRCWPSTTASPCKKSITNG